MFQRTSNLTERRKTDWTLPICIFLCLIVYFIMEAFCQNGIGEAFSFLVHRPLVFLYNAAIVFLPLLLVFLCKRRIFGTTIILILWLLLAIANRIILNNRVTPFTYQDFALLRDELYMITLYLSPVQLVFLCIGLLVLVAGLVLLFFKGPKYQGKISYKKVLLGIGGYLVGFVAVTALMIGFGRIETVFPNITISYLENGFPYSYWANTLNRGIHRPFGYSEEKVTALMADKEDTEPDEKPNIIMLQLESFFDTTYVKDWKLSEDPIPNFRKLKEDYSSGFLTVPGFGMGTVNTEFEVMTGMSVDFFGTGEYPYKTLLKNHTAESIAYNLLDLGYSTHAIHNNDATFYNRHKRFQYLGMETFTPIEFMNVTEYTPNGWAKDAVLTDEILKALDSTSSPDYIYAISVQGHGTYPTEVIDPNQTISLTCSDSEELRCGYEYYVNQTHEMDQFVGDLIAELEARDEKTILVLYGDHLPTFDLEDSDLVNNSIYQTEYVIWDNFGLEKEDKDLYTYQLSAEVGSRIGLSTGTLMYYHQNYQDSKDYLKNLKMLQYDMLYGKEYVYGGESPYQKVNTRYDVEDIFIQSMENKNGNFYVNGQNFTKYSKVYINGEMMETTYLGKQQLEVADVTVQPQDEIYIEQFGKNGKSHLWKSSVMVYQDN